MWTSLEGRLTVSEDESALERGRAMHHGRPAPDGDGAALRVTSELVARALHVPVCYQLDNAREADTATPVRALYTEFGWIARWSRESVQTGGNPDDSLGDFGLRHLLWNATELTERVHREPGAELTAALSVIAPALAVLSAEQYICDLDADAGVIRRWSAVVDGREARRLVFDVTSLGGEVEFMI